MFISNKQRLQKCEFTFSLKVRLAPYQNNAQKTVKPWRN